VCFIVITYAEDPDGVKRVKDMGKANACSRVMLRLLHHQPYYALGRLLHEVRDLGGDDSREEDCGIKVGNIYFDYDKFELKPKEKDELNQLANSCRPTRKPL